MGEFFTDSLLRGPTLGCMLMALSASLVGVLTFLRRRSLLGESLSHATYPGVIAAVVFAAFFFPGNQSALALSLLVGAFISSFLGLGVIDLLEKRWRISPDSALCFVLATFFGIGLTGASHIQFTEPQGYKQILVYLYGQAATMSDLHVKIYAFLALGFVVFFVSFYKELQVLYFDPVFARCIGLKVRLIDLSVYLLTVLAIVIGIRSVGIILMSAMLIGPAVAARQFVHKLSHLLLLAALFGMASGFLGNYLSVAWATPTGPMIVLVSSGFCLFALAFAPQRGLIIRMVRIARFRRQCYRENLLKALWRRKGEGIYDNSWRMRLELARLKAKGWITGACASGFELTETGSAKAAHIVRLHRLWEVYLCDYLGVGAEKVHANAEEMEHIITPELERELTRLLRDPKRDPHAQPIPSWEPDRP